MTQSSADAVIEALSDATRVLVSAHINADGDAIGSSLALARGLRALGKQAVVTLEAVPAKYAFLDPGAEIVPSVRLSGAGALDGFDLGVVLDAAEPKRLGNLAASFYGAPFPKICIDHHVTEMRSEYLVHHQDRDAAATGCILLPMLDRLGVEIDLSIGEALFVAIATDTGWFRFSNTSAEVLRNAARLVDAGVEPDPLYAHVYEDLSAERVRLQGRVLDRMQIALDGAFVWSYLDHATIRSCGVERSEFEGLIDPLRTVRGSEVSAFFTEAEERLWKVSLRSRGAANVQRVAAALDGGGHVKAAGCTVVGTRSEVEQRVIALVARELGG